MISGAKAQYQGTGTIDREGNYGFMLTVIDGQVDGGEDTFRMKIWDEGHPMRSSTTISWEPLRAARSDDGPWGRQYRDPRRREQLRCTQPVVRQPVSSERRLPRQC